MKFKLKLSVAAVALVMMHSAQAETLAEVEVSADRVKVLPSSSDAGLDAGHLLRRQTNSSDTARLLDGQPGLSTYGAGGVSSLPVIHGMADDRVRSKLDGMDLISSCANHMNPPLSYIDPARIANVEVYAGISPVSLGGDSIGGTIMVNSAEPEFAAAGETLFKGRAGVFYRSNDDARGGNLSATAATDQLSLRYDGSIAQANNYKAASHFKPAETVVGSGASPSPADDSIIAGNVVGSTAYRSENHQLDLGMRRDNHLFDLKLGLQNIPHQAFPNQRMDMTRNDSEQVNLHYTGEYAWGGLDARVYHEHTRHSMQFLNDKQFWYGALFNVAGMPMDTDGKNTGVVLKGELPLSGRDLLRLGTEYQRYRLEDYWSPVANSMMMGPGTFVNINNGQRDRYALFAEWETNWRSQWLTQLGARGEAVRMDAGAVQGYNVGTYGAAASAFNARDHQRTDHNLDLTALARYTPDRQQTFEAGYAMKTRSPNVHERYTWSNSNTMVMNMNNWFGDGNGYVGNLDLKPEVAHTVGFSASWHDEAQQDWEIKVAPYYTRVNDYIDAATCTSAGITCPARSDGFVNLTLRNQSARIYGADVSGKLALSRNGAYGDITTSGVLNYTRGENRDNGDNLYNIMPLNAKLALEQRKGNWSNSIEARLVDAKTDVQAIRKELPTGGYTLLNLYSTYEWKQARIDVGLENALDKFYFQPLGGAYVGQGATMSTGVNHGLAVPGKGRSLNTSLTVKF